MKKVSMFVCCVLGSMGLATANISYANMPNNTSGTSIHPRTGDSSDETKNNDRTNDSKDNGNKKMTNSSEEKSSENETKGSNKKMSTQSENQVQGQGQSVVQ